MATSGKPLTKVTLETFLRWKERKVVAVIMVAIVIEWIHVQLKDKQDKEASDLAKKKEAFKAGKTLGVSFNTISNDIVTVYVVIPRV